jgi:hypothetical protein
MKQNKNFNFQSMSSTNEKMLIIFSWIIVVIIVVLVGLYYGQQVREQEVSIARVQSAAGPAGVEVSSDSDSKVEEGELIVSKEAESVLTDSMTLNKNEFFCVQIGSHGEADFYDESKADSIIAEFLPKGLYSKKIIINPAKNQYVVQLGIFKSYEDAKTFLNSVKIKNYSAQIVIVPDPNAKIEYSPSAVASGDTKPAAPAKKEIVVSTPDSKMVADIKTPLKPEPAAQKTQPQQAVVAVPPVETPAIPAAPVETPVTPAAPVEPENKAAAVKVKPVEPEKKAEPVKAAAVAPAPRKTETEEAAAEEPSAGDETPPAEDASAVKPNFKIAAAKKEENKAPVKIINKAPEDEDEITAGDDEFEIVAEDDNEEASPAAGGSDKKGPYYVQIGTYKSDKNADSLKVKLKKMGVANVAVVPGQLSSGDKVYRVRMTGYASKESAGKAFNGVKSSFPDVKPYISK